MRFLVAVLSLLAAAPAFAGLALEVEVERAEVAFGEPIAFRVRFLNRGEEALRYFEPLFAGSNTFPDVRLVRRGDDRDLRPFDEPFQSMISPGLQGSIVRLGPGESKEYRFERARFLAVDRRTQKADWFEPRTLPDGEYGIRAVYERPDRMLPFDTGGFDVELRPVPGIFTGKVESAPAALRVLPPATPHLRISVPGRETTVVLVTLANPTDAPASFAGPARFEIASKMFGAAVAPVPAGELPGTVPPGETAECRIDLRRLAWRRTGGEGRPTGLAGVVPEGICHLRLLLGEGALASDGIWVRVPPAPEGGLEDVEVAAVLAPPGPVRAGAPVTLTVRIANRGDAVALLVRRLAFPRELLVRIEDADGLRPSSVSTTGRAPTRLEDLRPRGEDACPVARGLSWNRDRFEPAPGLGAEDFARVAPGEAVVREVELTGLLATGLTPGRYRISAGYRNVEPGHHLGFPDGAPAPTGTVWSEPVELVVSE